MDSNKTKQRPFNSARSKGSAEIRNITRNQPQTSKGAKPKRRPPTTGADVLANAERIDHVTLARIEAYLKEKLGDGPALEMIKCLSGSANPLPSPVMSNATTMLSVAASLGQSIIRRTDDNPANNVGLVTFSARENDTTLEAVEIHATALRKRTTPVLSAMADDYLGSDGGFFYTPSGAPGGGNLARHCGQALIWGLNIKDRAEAAMAKHAYRFPPGFSISRGIEIEWLDGADRAVGVMKAAARFFRPVQKWPSPATDDPDPNRQPKYAREVVAMRCLEVKAGELLGRRLFGKGKGIVVRAEVIEQARSTLKKGGAESRPPLQSAEILHRFFDLWKALGIEFRPVLIK